MSERQLFSLKVSDKTLSLETTARTDLHKIEPDATRFSKEHVGTYVGG